MKDGRLVDKMMGRQEEGIRMPRSGEERGWKVRQERGDWFEVRRRRVRGNESEKSALECVFLTAHRSVTSIASMSRVLWNARALLQTIDRVIPIESPDSERENTER